jgi:hypothetical protein
MTHHVETPDAHGVTSWEALEARERLKDYAADLGDSPGWAAGRARELSVTTTVSYLDACEFVRGELRARAVARNRGRLLDDYKAGRLRVHRTPTEVIAEGIMASPLGRLIRWLLS